MDDRTYTIRYPRRRFLRGLTRGVGRLVLRTFFDIDIQGTEHWPQDGPLILAGNHVAVMEAALMTVFAPWPPEVIASIDIPHEVWSGFFVKLYGGIMVKRGHFERAAMRQALEVLHQGGILGLFPEGGIWETGTLRPQTGVAWLSLRTGAPVVPIGFGGTLGALSQALRLKRPHLTMNIGPALPAASLPAGQQRKPYLEQYAQEVLDAIWALVPPDQQPRQPQIQDERFELQVTVRDRHDDLQAIPAHLTIEQAAPLIKLLYRPGILKLLRKNLDLPIQPLQHLRHESDPAPIAVATASILDYLGDDNPYLLTYRYGGKEAEQMRLGLEQLLALARWCAAEGYSLMAVPIRRYYSPEQGKEIEQIDQDEFEAWM